MAGKAPSRGSPLPGEAHAVQVGSLHDPGDTVAADSHPLCRQVGTNPRRAVGPARFAVHRLDVRRQLDIGARARRQRPLPRGVVPAGGDRSPECESQKEADAITQERGGRELQRGCLRARRALPIPPMQVSAAVGRT